MADRLPQASAVLGSALREPGCQGVTVTTIFPNCAFDSM